MARNKLIAKYATLNTEDLPERIYNKIQSFIKSEGIEDLPYLTVGPLDRQAVHQQWRMAQRF